MSTDEYRGAFCPQPPLEDRHDVDDRRRHVKACGAFRPQWEGHVYCVCGIHRSWHKEQKP